MECQAHTGVMERLVAVEASVKSAHRRIDGVEESQKILMEMNTNIRLLVEQNKVQDQKLERQDQRLESMDKDIKELKEKPAKRWDHIVTTIITVICSGFAGAAVALIIK